MAASARPPNGAVARLIELGFSQYEAQAYVGLLGREPVTGYALSNTTGIPQPKVYETLRRLVAKGVVAPVKGEPTRFVAVPAEQVLSGLEDTFRDSLAGAQRELAQVSEAGEDGGFRVLRSLNQWPQIAERAVAAIDGAGRHVYVSLHCPDPGPVAAALHRADDRGVACDVLHFGGPIVQLRNGRTMGHDSTHGVVYRWHQARHVAVVSDSIDVIWAVAYDGARWEGLAGTDRLLAALAKGYIRHDIYVQRIWADFHDELTGRYGPGMQQLVGELAAPVPPSDLPWQAGPAARAVSGRNRKPGSDR